MVFEDTLTKGGEGRVTPPELKKKETCVWDATDWHS